MEKLPFLIKRKSYSSCGDFITKFSFMDYCRIIL